VNLYLVLYRIHLCRYLIAAIFAEILMLTRTIGVFLLVQIPTCQDHFDILNSETLGDFQSDSPSDGHGPMHVFLGEFALRACEMA
jgi:hypothetical protein